MICGLLGIRVLVADVLVLNWYIVEFGRANAANDVVKAAAATVYAHMYVTVQCTYLFC